jgi:hypothetical protein
MCLPPNAPHHDRCNTHEDVMTITFADDCVLALKFEQAIRGNIIRET